MQCTFVDDQFLDGAEVIRPLGEGVELVKVSSGASYAIKRYPLPDDTGSMVREADALVLFRSSAEVIHMAGICIGLDNVSLIMEPMETDLLHYMIDTPFEVRMGLYDQLVTTLIRGLALFESVGLVHYDIKLQNILVRGGEFKIADFGLSRRGVGYLPALPTVYTLNYRPPEYLFGRYRMNFRKSVGDVWAAGVCLVEYIIRDALFFGTDESVVDHEIHSKSTLADMSFWSFVSMNMLGTVHGRIKVEDLLNGLVGPEQIELIGSMLNLNPDDRPLASQLGAKITTLQVQEGPRAVDRYIRIIIAVLNMLEYDQLIVLMAIEIYTRYLGIVNSERHPFAHVAAARLAVEYGSNYALSEDELLALYESTYGTVVTKEQLREAEKQLLLKLNFNVFRSGIVNAYSRLGYTYVETIPLSEFAKPLDRWFQK